MPLLAARIAAAQLICSTLYATKSIDPAVFAGVIGLLFGVNGSLSKHKFPQLQGKNGAESISCKSAKRGIRSVCYRRAK